MRTAIYIRVSTEEQAKEGYSIEAQKHKLTQYCMQNDWEIAGIYIDEGIGGSSLNKRTEAKRMLNDAKHKIFDTVLILKIDRLARNTLDLLNIVKQLQENNVSLVSLTERIETDTPTGKMFLTMLGGFAELERTTIIDRIKLGKEQKARSGRYNIGRIPYGYEYDADTKKLLIKEEEAIWVRKMFQMFLEGTSCYKIAAFLNKNKVPTRMNSNWTKSTVNKMLKNPTYIGKIRYRSRKPNSKKYETKFIVDSKHDCIEPIIDEDVFNQVQILFESRKKAGVKKASSENYTFGDVLYCSCGRKLQNSFRTDYVGKTKKPRRRYYYRCPRITETGLSELCKEPSKDNNVVERKFLEFFKDFKLDQSEITTKSKNELEEIDKVITGLDLSIEKINNRKRNLQLRLLDGLIEENDFVDLQKEIKEEEQALIEQLNIKTAERKNITGDKLMPEQIKRRKEIAKQINSSWKYMTKAEKKLFVSLFIKKIVLKNGEIHTIEFR